MYKYSLASSPNPTWDILCKKRNRILSFKNGREQKNIFMKIQAMHTLSTDYVELFPIPATSIIEEGKHIAFYSKK